ncbi:MAG TPA: M1 family aminopeptidase, partial [Thermoanaerobaculia bacterium]
FAIGRWTGRPILVFLFPVVVFLLCQSFLWGTYPPRISEAFSDVLRYVDPSGFRWLKESWLFTDRGIAFYNTRPVAFDAPFLLSRAGFALLGLLFVDLSRRHFTGRLRRPARVRRAEEPAGHAGVVEETRPLSSLAMSSRPPGFLSGSLAVARFELQELRSQPGLYIFIPFILAFLYILYRDARSPAFLSSLLWTPGVAAMYAATFLTMALGLLFLFYTVESLEREAATGTAPVFYATPVPTGSVVAGKVLANLAVLGVALLGALLVAALVILGQGKVSLTLGPFLIVWGLLLTPTLIVWITFVAAVHSLTRSRYTTYALGIAVAVLTGFLLLRGHMSWAGNWVFLGATSMGYAIPWTDMGPFGLDRAAVVLNRLFVLALSALFAWIAVRFLNRRDRDRLHPVLRPAERRRALLTGAALALPPLVLGFTLQGLVNQGFQGAGVRKEHKEYWRKNLATWSGQPLPYVTRVEMDLDFEPAARSVRVRGVYDLQNQKDKPLYWFPVTGGMHWQDLAWTLDGRPWQPEDRSRLYVFRPAKPLVPGASVRLGFSYRATVLPGISRNGGNLALGEFILPAGILLTGRNPGFVPKLGFDPKIGIDEDNRTEPRIYPPRFYEGVTDAELDRSAFVQRLRITAPAEYTVSSTGILESETVKDGRRTAVWVSDYPVRVFNVAAGRGLAVKRGPGTAVYYHPVHPWNVDRLLAALNGARRYYAEWYGPYPWRELRLNEFPAYAEYGRGNATNIFFSEGVGFLFQPTPENDTAFTIAAHESAHQWWGHIMQPGEGPGGIVLAEGAANFATLMLLEQMRGPQARQFYARQMEAWYGENRQPSDEKPLAETLELEGRRGDVTVIYDKGAWALWMLYKQMGQDAFLAGVKRFFQIYHGNPDHPVIEDFVAVMRPYAPDPKAFDDLVRQWFFELVVPEYRIEEKRKQPVGGGQWEVAVKVENAGTGRIPVEVAATRGERFDDKGRTSPEYRDARTTVVLGAGESKVVRIRCPFEPQRVVVDPDANVLQLQRRAAAARL